MIETLKSLLAINPAAIIPVVVFVGDATFKTPMPEGVTYLMGCIRYIKSKTAVLLSDGQVQEVIAAIEGGRLERSFKTNRQHVHHVKQIVRSKPDETLCPECGAVMVLRTSKKGAAAGSQFWGCSAFPKCRAVIPS